MRTRGGLAENRVCHSQLVERSAMPLLACSAFRSKTAPAEIIQVTAQQARAYDLLSPSRLRCALLIRVQIFKQNTLVFSRSAEDCGALGISNEVARKVSAYLL